VDKISAAIILQGWLDRRNAQAQATGGANEQANENAL